jgi:hypothetical protein
MRPKYDVSIDRTPSGRPKGFTVLRDGKVLARTGSTAIGRQIERKYVPNLPVQPKNPVEPEGDDDAEESSEVIAESKPKKVSSGIVFPAQESIKDKVQKGVAEKLAKLRSRRDGS